VPIGGGFDTGIYAFRLRGAPPAFAGPLILRLLGPHHEPGRVLRERAIQNALVELGYPAPRVLLATIDAVPLGGPFLVMEHLPGTLLPTASLVRMSRVLVELQLRLHALDPEPLLRALDREDASARGAGVAPINREVATFGGYLAQLERRIAAASLSGLVRTLRWLAEQQPRAGGRPVICHGDFHPQNILVSGRAVTGVLDWPNAIVAEPAFDVAATRIILKFVPLRLVTLPTPARWLAAIGRPILARRYLALYRRHRPLAPDRIAYYEVANCMRALVRIGESRRRGSGPDGAAADPLDAPRYSARLVDHIAEVTGVAASLPTVAA
jgi:aminoglycoside phosphotransferase (APT) family kinase protein